MYRTNDPRFRRRLNEIGQTLESANETAQSSIYIFGQTYVRPCFASIGHCVTTCVDASCPSLNLSQRDRLRRQRGRGRSAGRAELNFDFYDDWDDDENDGLLGWGNDEFDRLVNGGSGTATGGTGAAGYGTLSTTTQPSRSRGMAYQPKHAKRKPTVLPHEPGGVGGEPTVIAETGFWGRLFGGKGLRYQPSAADLQEHPGTLRLGRDITEGEALLSELEGSPSHRRQRPRRHNRPRKDSSSSPTGRTTRARSGTTGSADTRDSYSSRGDLWPSDEEADAIPLDDEFAMVLERRLTGSEPASTNGSVRRSRSSTNAPRIRRRDSRPSASSRASTRRTFSSRSSLSANLGPRSRVASGVIEQLAGDESALVAGESDAVPIGDAELLAEVEDDEEDDDSDGAGREAGDDEERELVMPTLSELKREERELALEEDAAVERRRENAQRLAVERGLATSIGSDEDVDELPSKEAPPPQDVSTLPPEMRETASATITSAIAENKGDASDAAEDGEDAPSKDETAKESRQ